MSRIQILTQKEIKEFEQFPLLKYKEKVQTLTLRVARKNRLCRGNRFSFTNPKDFWSNFSK